MGSLKQRWAARLISAVVTLALVFASSIGIYTHARAHCQHGHAHLAQHQDSGAASVSSAMEHKESQKAPAANQADCCDTICHGGYAIVGQASPLLALPQSKPRIPMMRADAGAEPRSLDRPPRSSVLS